MLQLLQRLPIQPRGEATPHGMNDYYDALFHLLRSQLGSFEVTPRSIGVTSCGRAEGVTTTCAHLAASAAHHSSGPVLILETDSRRDRHGLTVTGRPTVGLYDLLLGKADVRDCLQATEFPNVSAIGTGIHMSRGSNRYPKHELSELLTRLKSDYPLIVVDLPHAQELTDCFSICGLLDGVLLVVEAEKVRAPVARRAKELLVQADANLLGVVFNKRRNHVPDWLYRRL